jgi:isorenieratene synthase
MAVTPANDPFEVVVIGGGLAGLAAAAHLAAKGVVPLVLDADHAWTGGRLAGGEAYTFSYQGREWSFRDEHGLHAIWGGYVNLRAMLERFTTTQLQPSFGEEWINRWGKHVRRIEAGNAIRSRWIPAPFHYLQLLFNPAIWANISPWDFLSLPGVLASILLTVGVDPIREGKAWDGLTLNDYFTGWTPNLKATFKGLGVNLLASPAEHISLSGFIAALRFYTMLRRDSWQMSYYPEDGNTSVIAPLIQHIEAHGGRIQRGSTATRLERESDLWRITVEASDGTSRTLLTRYVVLATHPSGAQRLLTGSDSTKEIAATLVFPASTQSAVIRLWFSVAPREGVQGGMLTGDFVPDNFFWLHRLYSDYRQWHNDTGGSAIEVHFYPDKKHANLPDANLLILATSEVQAAFPELRGAFVYGTVRRNSKVHSVFRVPDHKSLHVVTPFENVFACGDWVGHDTPSLWMERATTTGIAAANEVLSQLGHEPYEVLYPPQAELLVRVIERGLRGIRWIVRKVRRQKK